MDKYKGNQQAKRNAIKHDQHAGAAAAAAASAAAAAASGHVDPHHNIPRRAFKTIDMY
jgi:hypothetical protein